MEFVEPNNEKQGDYDGASTSAQASLLQENRRLKAELELMRCSLDNIDVRTMHQLTAEKLERDHRNQQNVALSLRSIH
uniref:Uncharacterized protein n=1 Tax=Glossina palpalis gambiensis TaxID=67801 RepID=A0A1B0C5C7_9MUSC